MLPLLCTDDLFNGIQKTGQMACFFMFLCIDTSRAELNFSILWVSIDKSVNQACPCLQNVVPSCLHLVLCNCIDRSHHGFHRRCLEYVWMTRISVRCFVSVFQLSFRITYWNALLLLNWRNSKLTVGLYLHTGSLMSLHFIWFLNYEMLYTFENTVLYDHAQALTQMYDSTLHFCKTEKWDSHKNQWRKKPEQWWDNQCFIVMQAKSFFWLSPWNAVVLA